MPQLDTTAIIRLWRDLSAAALQAELLVAQAGLAHARGDGPQPSVEARVLAQDLRALANRYRDLLFAVPGI